MIETMSQPPGVAVASRVVGRLLRHGLPLGPLWLLQTRGRRTGRLRSAPIALVRHAGDDWLVAPFGDVGWVRNYRQNGSARLIRGRARRPVELIEVTDERRVEVLRRYRTAYRFVPFVRQAFTARPGDGAAAFAAEAERMPVFRIDSAPRSTTQERPGR